MKCAAWISSALLALAVAGSARAQTFEPDSAPITALEARYGRNILEPDPLGLGPPEGVADDVVLNRWYGDAPRSLNAILTGDAGVVDSLTAYCTLDPALRHRKDPGKWQAGSADYVGVSEGGRVTTVRLRAGIRWQFPAVDRGDPRHRWLEELFQRDPPELTAGDFKFTFDAIVNPAIAATARLRGYYAGAHMRVLDRRTYQVSWDHDYDLAPLLSMTFDQVLPEFLFSRTEDGAPIPLERFPEEIEAHWHNNRICGYGPYHFVKLDPNVEIVLRRADDFPVFRPAVREIRWKILSDAEQCVLRMKGDQLDFTVLMADQYRKYCLDAPAGSDFRGGRFGTLPYEKAEHIYIAWNCRRPPFDDARVRRAMTHAFNREAIVAKAFAGLGRLVNSPVYFAHPYCDTGLEPLAFDLGAASTLLDEAGWGDADGDGVRDRLRDGKRENLSFSLSYFAGVGEMDATTAVYRDDLARIGVEMKPVPLTWPVLRASMDERSFDAFTGATALGWEIDLYPTWHSSQALDGSNYSGFADSEVDDLLVRYRASKDATERKTMLFRVQQILHQNQPYLFLVSRTRMMAFQPWLAGVDFALARPQLLSFNWYRREPEPLEQK